MANERHTDIKEFEVDSSTRQSVHSITKYQPFRLALSTTASNLVTAGKGEQAVNWVTNPSIEATDVTMYTATGASAARSTAQAATGSASLLINPANSAAGEGFYWTSAQLPFSVHEQYITVQCEHRGASASGNVKIEIRDVTGATVLATSGNSNLAASFTRVTASYTVPETTTAAQYRIYVTTGSNHNIDFYIDKLMFEVREDVSTVSTYVDGNQGLNYEWVGTANASNSIKRPAMSKIRGIKITNESGSAGEIVYVSLDTTATATTGIPVLAGATLETNWPLDFRDKVSVISASGTPTVSGVVWGYTLV
jgi:hypothetical protein